MRSNLLPVSRFGFKYIGVALCAFIVFSLLDLEFLAVISAVLIVVFVFVYRNPERELVSFEQESLLSPADGTVVSIDEIENPEYTYRVEIESSYMDVGVLRAPFDSCVKSLILQKGARLSKESPLSQDLNENVEITFENTHLNKVKIRHVLKRSFDEINIDLAIGQNIKQSSRYGFVSNATTILYLPQNFRLNIALGSEVKASQTLIGYFS